MVESVVSCGVRVTGGEDVTVQADGDVTIASVQNQTSRDLKLDIKTGGFLGTETNIRRQSSSVDTEATTITAGRDLSVISETGDVTLQAPQIKSGGETRLEAEEGKVALLTNTDQSFKQDFKREEDLFWWNERDQGKAEETIRHVEIEAGGGLKIDAGNGIVIEYHKTGNLEASLDQLSQSPGLSWVGEIRNDPAFAGKVDWKAVDAQFQQWDYKSQGLTEAGAALVTLITAALTGPMTGFTSSLTSSVAGSLGLAGNAVAEAAIQAGLQSLINKSAVALVNNQGDIGAALKELGSSANIRALLTSMVAAGLTIQLADMAGLGQSLPASAPLSDRIAQELQHNLIRASVKASVSTAIEGGRFDKALADNLRLAASDTLGTVVAQEIGAAYRGGKIDVTSQLIAHAALGCATGAIASGDCGAGAAGAFAGEVAAKLQIQQWSESKLEQYASLQGRQLTPDEAAALRTSLEADFRSFKAQGVDIARLAGGLAAALTGGDVDTGADAGGNAAANNSFALEGAAAGCAVGAAAAGAGCLPGAGVGALGGLAVDAVVIILGVAGLIYLNEEKKDAINSGGQEGAQSGTGSAAGSPPPDDDDKNTGEQQRELSNEEKRAIRSYEKRIAEHEAKLQDFKSNPTVRPGMEGQPNEVIAQQHAARIKHLETEINTFKSNILKIQKGLR